MSKTLFEKLWDLHTVADFGDGEALMSIDRVFLHERTGSIALQSIAEEGYTHRQISPTRFQPRRPTGHWPTWV